MSVPFDPRLNLVVVNAILWGPNGSAKVKMALDTGSTSTLVNAPRLAFLGYDPITIIPRIEHDWQPAVL